MKGKIETKFSKNCAICIREEILSNLFHRLNHLRDFCSFEFINAINFSIISSKSRCNVGKGKGRYSIQATIYGARIVEDGEGGVK